MASWFSLSSLVVLVALLWQLWQLWRFWRLSEPLHEKIVADMNCTDAFDTIEFGTLREKLCFLVESLNQKSLPYTPLIAEESNITEAQFSVRKAVSKSETLISFYSDLYVDPQSLTYFGYDYKYLDVPTIVDGYALYILKQVKEGKNSNWYPLLNMIPRTLRSPVHWSEEQMEWIRGTTTFNVTKSRRMELNDRFKEVLSSQINNPNPLFFTIDDYLWAVSVVLGMVVKHPYGARLFPFLYFIPVSRYQTLENQVEIELVIQQEKFEIVSSNPADAGSLLVRTTNISSAHLAIQYGTIIRDNSHHGLKLGSWPTRWSSLGSEENGLTFIQMLLLNRTGLGIEPPVLFPARSSSWINCLSKVRILMLIEHEITQELGFDLRTWPQFDQSNQENAVFQELERLDQEDTNWPKRVANRLTQVISIRNEHETLNFIENWCSETLSTIQASEKKSLSDFRSMRLEHNQEKIKKKIQSDSSRVWRERWEMSIDLRQEDIRVLKWCLSHVTEHKRDMWIVREMETDTENSNIDFGFDL